VCQQFSLLTGRNENLLSPGCPKFLLIAPAIRKPVSSSRIDENVMEVFRSCGHALTAPHELKEAHNVSKGYPLIPNYLAFLIQLE
jgi:hypothetical protein